MLIYRIVAVRLYDCIMQNPTENINVIFRDWLLDNYYIYINWILLYGKRPLPPSGFGLCVCVGVLFLAQSKEKWSSFFSHCKIVVCNRIFNFYVEIQENSRPIPAYTVKMVETVIVSKWKSIIQQNVDLKSIGMCQKIIFFHIGKAIT